MSGLPNNEFYQSLGKLFYAVAVSDNNVRDEEVQALKTLVNEQWLTNHQGTHPANSDQLHAMETMFDTLRHQQSTESNTLFDDFLSYKRQHAEVFNATLNQLIYDTAHAIASSFAKRNKSELILLAKLKIALNIQ